MPKLQKIISLVFLWNISRKRYTEVDFLDADKQESFLQVDTMIIDADGQAFPKFPKYKVCNVFTISCKKG